MESNDEVAPPATFPEAPTASEARTPPNAPARGGALSRILEWFWQGRALAAASREAMELSPKQRLLVEQSRALFDLGERVRDRITTVTSESSDTTALVLFHQAAALALDSLGGSRADAWAARRVDIVRRAELDAASVARLDELFPAHILPDTALGQAQSKADADILQRALGLLVTDVEAAYRQADVVRGLRFFRVAVLVLASLAATWGGFSLAHRLLTPPNLLEGKAWQASSTYPGLNVSSQVCDGKATAIFFHTQRELHPWVRFDIGKVTTVRRVEVRNRTDYGGNRALPLVISLSQDGQKWSEVGRKTDSFKEWILDFPPMEARYVRAQTLDTTWLHLEWIKAR
ncbi:MAG: discoidin domain-containing protein [Polyangiaceae bacterium]|nr:discoidin domain-containing protein [Polyangiaceae bacterium]